MQIIFLIFLFILGACMGSFLCCQARRLHLRTDRKGNRSKSLGARSVCLSCKKPLKWYDNLPIISWLFLRGKCRRCGAKIGLLELFSELGTAIAFLTLGTTVNVGATDVLSWTTFVATIVLICVLVFLAIYDGMCGELPTLFLVLAVFCAIAVLYFKSWGHYRIFGFTWSLITDPLFAVIILGGLYLALYLISKGKWVGDGDWLLGTAIALALGSPWLALIALFLSNAIACLTMYPLVKGKRQKKIYFGPFLVIAFVITATFSDFFQSML